MMIVHAMERDGDGTNDSEGFWWCPECGLTFRLKSSVKIGPRRMGGVKIAHKNLLGHRPKC